MFNRPCARVWPALMPNPNPDYLQVEFYIVRLTRKRLIFVGTVIWVGTRITPNLREIHGLSSSRHNMAAQSLTFNEIFWICYTYFVMLFPIVVTNTYIQNVKGRCILSRCFFWVQVFALFGILIDFILYSTDLNKSKFITDLSPVFNILLPARFLFWEIFMCSSLLYMFFTAFRVYHRLLDQWERELEEEDR